MLDKYLKVPYALNAKDWVTWNKKTKKEHPIAWFFYNDVSRFFGRKAYWVERKYWKLQHKYNPKHQYTKLDTGLAIGYHDPSEQIKGAIFTTVVKYCKENQFVWDERYEKCQTRIDLQTVADWHTIIRPRLQATIDQVFEDTRMDDLLSYFDGGGFSPDDRYSKRTEYLEAKVLRLDKKMMCLAIKHIEEMWY